MKVTVFGATWCAFCKTEKQWLESKDVKFNYIDVDKDEAALKYITDITGAQSVPVTVIETNESDTIDYVRGFDRQKLTKVLGI